MSGGISRFLAWWGGELAALVPGPLRRLVAPQRPQLVARATAEGVALALHRPGRRPKPLGALHSVSRPRLRRLQRALARGRILSVLAVPEASALRRTARLPLAAEEDLGAVIAFELDRLTPFRPDELYYAWRLRARRPETSEVEVEIALAPRAEHANAAAALAEAGLGPPARIDLVDGDGRLAGLDLSPKAGDPKAGRGALATAALLLAVLAIAGAWAWIEIAARDREAEALEDALFQARRLARALSDTEAPEAGGAAALAAYRAKAGAPRAVTLLADISETLPDGTWLDSLTLDEGGVTLGGVSDQASRLPALLAARPGLAAPRFAAPIVSAEAGRERFLLRLELTPRTGEAAE